MIVLYYLLFENSTGQKWEKKLSRSKLVDFERARLANRKIAEEELAKADYDLLEFDRLNQTPNHAYALKFRLELLAKFISGKSDPFAAT